MHGETLKDQLLFKHICKVCVDQCDVHVTRVLLCIGSGRT